MDEFGRIATHFAPLAMGWPGAHGLADDAAEILFARPARLVVTQDTLVETIHFMGDESPAQLAKKALRVNLSDLAAKGARPLGYFLSLSLPARCDDDWVAGFAEGLHDDQQQFLLHLMGGDSTSSPQHIAITITALGTCPDAAPMIRRNGAQAGDLIFVTGTIGDAWLGLQALQGKTPSPEPQPLIDRYLLPEPRLGMAHLLHEFATACLDISDGLLQDLGHICETSGLSAEVALEKLPLSKAALAAIGTSEPETLLPLATGGDDYELLFTAPAVAKEAVIQRAAENGIAVTDIGRMREKGAAMLELAFNGQKVSAPEQLGYRHFA